MSDTRDCVVTIVDIANAETPHLIAALSIAARHQHLSEAKVFVSPRTSEGWLEYIVVTKYATGGGMTIGVIQRRPGAEIECHS